MKIDLVLPNFTPAMCGDGASVYIKEIPVDRARELVTPQTQVLARDLHHMQSARHLFPNISGAALRYADLRPGMKAVFLKYSGPAIRDDQPISPSATFRTYLIEVEEYQEAA